jgi:hypothetical protein
LKKAVLMLIPAVTSTFGRKIAEEEEVLMNLSDMLMQVYVAEATALRIEKLEGIKNGELPLYRDILDVLMQDVANIIYKSGYDAVLSFAPENEVNHLQQALFNLSKLSPVNVKDARRRIADKLIEDNLYNF